MAEKEAGNWPLLSEAEWAYALRFARLRADIARQGEGDTPLADALANLQILRQQIEQQTAKVVGYRTWYHKQQQITDTEKAALMAWRNDLVNTGKGHGKNAARNMESAVRNLKVAKGAVPVWIMSQDAAIRFFPEVQPGQFDLLIVDEASQCDISLLNLMFRARKTMVVGDENQTSVSVNANQFPIERTNRLLDRYLSQHPFREQFNINNRTTSVYTLSSVIYPNIVSLREHFRCRPEIISFSNIHMYDGRITPLKSATDDRFGEPLVAHYVEDDPKDASKPQIVQQALTLIEDLVKDFESGVLDKLPTVGILCLDASNEAHRDKLNSALSRSQILRPYADELGLLVGTSREFQGDERDIMILTTTASHRFTAKGKIRPPRAVLNEEMSRIYNVAASRAREKMLLLHSIHPEALSLMNPDCLRFQLIRHCEGSGEERQIRRVADGQRPQWEQELAQTLGPDWQASYPVGEETLDWASMAGGRKRAVVVWGRTPVARLLVLMRAGWQLFPVSALGWQLNATAVKEELEAWKA
ncbi:MAG: AAA domain-containing protein [Bacteroidota bacterium]